MHALQPLAGIADLVPQLMADIKTRSALGRFWSIARDWSEEKRYHVVSESEARSLFEAISEPTDGVLQWIRAQW